MAMAAPQVFYQQNKGTLVPGQSISVNKYTVQVERYLSQGGFAHVYLVRTATPVYNTTHHVLKRIAVANEAMLTDVKKEVDIMRLLKGHPNIVHLIDAAWHKMSNGLFEVFILMEFCPGGGIIDMMNRRLRERLTEAEILQIFVDVCEGVAYMHNSRPPLLHRDLKVENILQASPTSFKLCDFGSATTVAPRPPSNMQEIRALEDDLNRHTTLQYRAPEMIDAHLRRPIDEKSDVWALGVLLYKLCYYTTPFEEHGPLAILNVQYRIPPYPVYSSQMNALIGSMLREHGTQRPTVFELLSQVHRLRGTRSQFQYRIPSPQPLSPRHQTQFKSPSPNPVQSTISYRQGSSIAATINPNSTAVSTSPSQNAGVQARDKVLEAIAPMRRGRPITSKESPTSSRPPSRERNADLKGRNWLEDEEKAWEAATAKNAIPAKSGEGLDDAWTVATNQGGKSTAKQGFGDDFGEQLWKAPDPNSQLRTTTSSTLKPPATAGPATKSTVVRPSLISRSSDSLTKSGPAVRGKEKDAFDGLGLPSNDKHAPTLAEARKLRTGLAVTSSKSPNIDPGRPEDGRYNGSIPRPSPSPRPSYLSSPQVQSQSLSPVPALQPATSGSSWSSQPPSRPSSSQRSPETLAAETRFPSLEELDASFNPGRTRGHPSSSVRPGPLAASQPQLSKPQSSQSNKMLNVATSGLPRPAATSLVSHGNDGVRSEQVTGVAMRAGATTSSFDTSALNSSKPPALPTSSSNTSVTRGSSIRRHRSSISMKPDKSSAVEPPTSPVPSKKANLALPEDAPTPRLPPRPSQRDWLTGDDDASNVLPVTEKRSAEASKPVLRESPSKRASFIEKSTIPIHEGVPITHEHAPLSLAPPASSSTASAEPESPSRRAHRVFPELDTTVEPAQTLTDNWSPIAASSPLQLPESRKDVDSASSADEGPEDANRYVPPAESKKPRRKGRQSSVHDLVDLWGGGFNPEKKRERESVRSTVTPSPKKGSLERRKSLAAPATSANTGHKSASPQPAVPSSSSRPSGMAADVPKQQTPATSPPLKSSSSRSRPQSMFVFPSKSKDPSAPPSAGLSPPPEPEARVNTRRTSITDMVQRYEAIDAVARSSGTSTALPKPASLKVSTSNQENGPASGSLPSPSKRIGRSISSGIPRASPISLTPQTSTSSTTSEEKPKEIEVSTPRARRIPVKPDASQPPFSSRTPSVPAEDLTRSNDPRSPSPEQPYQGVGRLIDQWQRKTAETAEATRTPVPKRGAFVAKRAGLVSDGNRG